MQSFWEDSLEVIFFPQEEKHRQGPSFFFPARKPDALVLPGSPTLCASAAAQTQPQGKQLGWDLHLPLPASTMSGRVQTEQWITFLARYIFLIKSTILTI